ncbi:MAG: formate dehydrogenase [Hyphomonadaceae bacterium]|nr:formate dehydrogenase [Hyphomonadaceae bacterium]
MVTLLNKVEDEYAKSVCLDFGNKPDALIEILHVVQNGSGFLSDGALRTIADSLNITRAEIHGVVSFYHDFKREAPAKQVIKICRAEACQAVGCDDLISNAETMFGVKLGKHNDDVELKEVFCLGNCALGPAIMIDDELYGRVTIKRLEKISAAHIAAKAGE